MAAVSSIGSTEIRGSGQRRVSSGRNLTGFMG